MVCEDGRVESFVPMTVHESDMARMERSNFRLSVIVVVLVILLFGSNAAWIAYESQFEEVVTTEQTVTQETDGGNNSFVGGDYYGGEADG